MTINQTKKIADKPKQHHFVCIDKPSTNALGETALPYAPLATLANGHQAVPQQYLQVQRSLENLEHILERIEFSDSYILFAGQNYCDIYLQVGVIGVENYPRNEQERHINKVVYGRRWVIEPSTPTSEVIQTAMLAIKKVREHELREKVTLRIDQNKETNGRLTTPFNNHMDLPLMSGNSTLLRADTTTKAEFSEQIKATLKNIKVGSLSLEIDQIVDLNEQQTAVVIQAQNHTESLFPELLNTRIALVCEQRSESEFLHELMSKLVTMSDLYVEQHFSYQKFTRFSRELCPKKIASFSYETRNIKSDNQYFNDSFKDMSYQVDQSKTPSFSGGKLGLKQRKLLVNGKVTGGHLPK